MRGLWKLTWLEAKIFIREPLGLLASVAMPVLLFVTLGRLAGGLGASARERGIPGTTLGVFTAMLIILSALLSLVTIIATYREAGILKRLRATPLRPTTILSAHVLVKLLTTALTLAAMVAAGRQYFPPGFGDRAIGFTAALLLSAVSMLSIGFVLASLVPTARFAQPVGSVIFYPMIALSGLFFPIEALPPALETAARVMPLTYVVSLLRGILAGEPWTAHLGDAAALVVVFVVSIAVSARVFRWE